MERTATVTDELRRACAEVTRRARHVRLVGDAIPVYAAALRPVDLIPGAPAADDPPGSRAERASHWLTLDAINFGSGWFPTLRKRDGLSGSRTIAAGWRAHYDAEGPFSAAQLAAIEPEVVAVICGQEPGHELMGLYALALRDLGGHLQAEFDARPEALVDAARGSAPALAARLGGWACFADRSRYGELSVPFLKRAQIAAADLERAGVVRWDDGASLTMFADNLVPHVLRIDGILELDPGLASRIQRGDLIEHGSAEEVELRACAVQAVELIVAARRAATDDAQTTAGGVDQLLWERGQQPRYKAQPRPRCRCTAY